MKNLDVLLNLRSKIFIACVCILPVLLYIPLYSEPMHSDDGLYSTVARELLFGSVLYKDVFNPNGPVFFAWYIVAFTVFGFHVWAPHLVSAITLSVSGFFIYLTARRWFSQRTAYLATLLFALSTGVAAFWQGAEPHHFLILPIVIALYCLARGRTGQSIGWFFLCGIASGFAVMTRHEALVDVLAFSFFALFPSGKVGSVWNLLGPPVAILAGCAVVVAAVTAPLVLHGAGPEMSYAYFEFPKTYARSISFDQRVQVAKPALEMVVIGSSPWLLLSVVGAAQLGTKRVRWQLLLLIVLITTIVLSILASGRSHRFYFQHLLPPLALLSAVGANALWRPPRVLANRIVWAGLACGFVVTAVVAVNQARPSYVGSPEERHVGKHGVLGRLENRGPSIGKWIAEYTREDEKIYVLGFQDELYFYSGRRPALRWLHPAAYWADPISSQRQVDEFMANPPTYVVDTILPLELVPGIFWQYPRAYRRILPERYDLMSRVEGVNLWKLRDHPEGVRR